MDDLISRQSALDALDKHFESFIKRFGYDSYERADEKTKLVCDGLSEAEDVIIGLPSATDTNVGTKLVIDPYKIECAIRGLTEWQKHVQTESDIDRDISVAVEALKAQLGTNLAEVGTKIEPLTDKEQRIFLAAMRRERKVCKYAHEPCEVPLTKVCDEIVRKVKGALWI